MIHFDVSEFCITDDPLPIRVADMMLNYHIVPLSRVRGELQNPVYISKNSGYRPVWYEKEKGRSGQSAHTYNVETTTGKGASDVTADNINALFKSLCSMTNYTRIAYYPDGNFYHCDYEPVKGGGRHYFENTENGWKWIKEI